MHFFNNGIYSQNERIKIVIDIVKKLVNYKTENGIVNLYNDEYSYVSEFKKISNDYIHNEKTYSGILEFVEIGKKIEYYLPIRKKNKPKFIILKNK
jgi:negative regulator of genetic competence, sporulation and motility